LAAAAANAIHLMPEPVDSRRIIAGSKQQQNAEK
jgi:hypothetical protein